MATIWVKPGRRLRGQKSGSFFSTSAWSPDTIWIFLRLQMVSIQQKCRRHQFKTFVRSVALVELGYSTHLNLAIFQKMIFIPCLIPVHGYTHNNFSKYFWIFTKPLVSCFRKTPWFWVSFKFNLGKFDIRKKNSQSFCKVAKLR